MLIEYAYCRNAKLVSNRDTGAGSCKIKKPPRFPATAFLFVIT